MRRAMAETDSPDDGAEVTPSPHPVADGSLEPAVALAGWQVDDAVGARRRAWWLARQAEAEATLVGVLLDLAEHGRVVVLTLLGGRVRTGRLWGVGPGALALRVHGGLDAVIATRAIVSVRPGPATPDRTAPAGPIGDRTVGVPGSGSFAEAVAGLVDDRPSVQVLDATGVVAEGRLDWVGVDVAHLTGDDDEVRYVALDGIVEVVVHGP